MVHLRSKVREWAGLYSDGLTASELVSPNVRFEDASIFRGRQHSLIDSFVTSDQDVGHSVGMYLLIQKIFGNQSRLRLSSNSPY
jgi:hypothetical protein